MEFTTGGRLEVRITASDVGKRVSVRSLTAAGERLGRFTDTVGILTSWTGGVLRITRRDGEHVEIEEESMVAGKTVPQTPARRRGVPSATVRELVTVAARGWPPAESERLGEWTLRAAGGFTSRANSVLPLGDPGGPLPAAADRAVRWYAARGLPARVQVTVEDDALLDRELRDRGWTAERFALVRVGALAPLADREPDQRVVLSREPGSEWASLYHRAEGGGLPEAALTVLRGGPSVWFATVPGAENGSGPAAIGRCVVDGRWAGFAAIEVAPGRRGEGLARAVMAELARAALAEGASAAYLQIERGNEAARALYDKLGFVDHHAYHYLRAPQG
ncbi:GNAT family N-acetyltransferase [Streptomyces iconiensis]|uniref:GNAT family N-acetyltransferase n=1 Tax=Streptomyces iconiensis TaxID=1384038 RepID=A0ABT7A5S9_9ACTN|nr:GNAT family N-acetyltransferase [Streptomyces iconiensis]MDJ1136702.1 GNAT family N-acetyltransferase [Streptomyces iconiensis]